MSSSDPGERQDRRPGSLMERLRGLFGLGSPSVREDIEDALSDPDDPDDPGAFTPQERAMLRNVLNLHELRVEDVMVPRADIIAVSEEMTLGEVLTVFQSAGHSRLPVHGGTLDDARGMVHIRDFVALLAASSLSGHIEGEAAEAAPDPGDLGRALWRQTLKTAGLVRSVLFVPPSMQALDLLVRMQAVRTHMALVIDEYGGTDGLVSIEDVVEMIVGDIEDEHDEGEGAKVTVAADGSFIADARADLAEVSEAVGVDLSGGEDAEVDTLGGLIGSLAGHVPGRGEIVEWPDGLVFEVLDADPRRVKRVRITRKPPPGAAEQAGADEKAAAPDR